ncbi:hypothetical protein CHS0354_009006 [Potamilus streckersoni]|uniref:C-type lectin domain-containing protein n=1 Tax=Potamilus streckersoni TaxID=2493646 RepID=A0AAE0THN4_9BIVA|nr:hypothetical protein CHS0354_009006 [Potamilus streckersoni]
MRKILLCLACITLGVSYADNNCTSCRECPAGWKRNGKSCYFFSISKETWIRAKRACENMGGHLATLATVAEDAFVSSYLKSIQSHLSDGKYVWLGGHDLFSEGQWKWVTGETFSYTNWRKGGENGQVQNPDNAMGMEHCLDWSNGWNDNICHHKHHFLCENDLCV